MASRGYADLHEHLAALKKAGLLITVERPINKDTEMHPLVRWQFRGGIEERDRKAFLFTNVVDSRGRKYDIPVVVGALAASREIYRLGMGCDLERINETWSRALANPIEPRVVRDAPCQEIVIEGSELDKPGKGLDSLPIPISTPGWDIAPFTTLSQYITKDPDNGIQNMGIYRGQVKAPRRLGMNPSLELRPGIYVHWEKMKRAGKKLPAAVVLGAPPRIAFASAQKAPETLDELHLAGGLAGVPINVVKARTVDLLVPAEAEIVVEGCIDTEYLEPEAPFGESHGHVNLQEFNAYMDVACITRRRDAILTSIISQVTPSESSLIKRVALEPLFLEHLRNALGIRGVKRVSMHEPLTNLRKVVVLIMDRNTPGTEIWRALYGAAAWNRAAGKYVIAVNDDIDPDNADVLPRQPRPGSADPAAPRPGARATQQAQQRRGCVGADRRDDEGGFPADLAAQARVHGARKGDLGGARPAQAQARVAVVRLLARRVARRAGVRRGHGGEGRLLRDQKAPGEAAPQGRGHEHRGARAARPAARRERRVTSSSAPRRSAPARGCRSPARNPRLPPATSQAPRRFPRTRRSRRCRASCRRARSCPACRAPSGCSDCGSRRGPP